MLSGIFHLIPLYWGSLIPKWKAFLPNQVQFSCNLGFLRWFLTFIDKIVIYLFTPFVPFIVLKTTVLNTRFQRKNRFEKRTTLSRDIEEKAILVRGLVWHAMLKHIFANKKIWKFCPWTSKIPSKTLNCGKTWPDWAKRLFI